jgi:hypothetical protein
VTPDVHLDGRVEVAIIQAEMEGADDHARHRRLAASLKSDAADVGAAPVHALGHLGRADPGQASLAIRGHDGTPVIQCLEQLSPPLRATFPQRAPLLLVWVQRRAT